jgi:hypothetical protein
LLRKSIKHAWQCNGTYVKKIPMMDVPMPCLSRARGPKQNRQKNKTKRLKKTQIEINKTKM